MEGEPAFTIVRFGVFDLDLKSGELRRAGLKVKLQDQPFQVLALLLEHPGEIVTPDEIISRLWPEGTIVEYEHSIKTAVKKLRDALDDDADNPRFVETVPRRGYRFIAPVHLPGAAALGSPTEYTPVVTPAPTAPAPGPPAPNQRDIPRKALESAIEAVIEVQAPRARWQWWAGLAVAFLLALAVYWLTRPPMPPRVVDMLQITHDGRPKFPPILTDGSRLYYSGVTAGDVLGLYQVSVAGGDSTPIPTPFPSPVLADISGDGSQLLVQGAEGTLWQGPLWVLPTLAGSPHRLGGLSSPALDTLNGVLFSSAEWSADGKTIAYSKNGEVDLAASDGTESRRLATVTGIAYWLRWSPDGRRVRFTLANPERHTTSLWEVADDGSHLHPLLSSRWNRPAAECCGSWTPDGRYFVFESIQDGRSNIWAFRESRGLLHSEPEAPVPLTSGPLDFYGPVPSRDGKRLFVIGAQVRGELVRYDSNSRQFSPYLLGISADGVDFSRDGQWVTYLTVPEGTLWRSKVDGTERLELTFPPLQPFLPRWSPDGKRIAFAAVTVSHKWHLFYISANGGDVGQLTHGEQGEIDVGWSPDGKRLVFGPVGPREAGTLPLSFLDLETHQVSPVPGSEGLYSPRWSPDGRYLAALKPGPETLWLFDFSVRKWVDLKVSNVGYPSWSRDSRYLYFDAALGGDAFYRLRITDHKLERLASLQNLRTTGNFGGAWTGLALDDAPLVLRDIGTEEIYALDWEAP